PPSTLPRPPTSPPFPYPTLFRSLRGDDGEAAAMLAGPRGLDGGVEREQVRLIGDLFDDGDAVGDHLHGLAGFRDRQGIRPGHEGDRKSTRLNSSHVSISYAVFCL